MGNIDDLSIRCITSEEVMCKFKPISNRLHVMDYEKLMENGNKFVFGENVIITK